ncbi:transcription elongation factor GreA [Amygdalobacter nucleatus]|uniref:transcription elongation factor GreA n=1 Tax=Amygdalobacter nucleatus TaxID=3029274 RepID=UPI00279FA9FE|nr:transcription elongation factor GreA [Amygdalobacter nucleatus]WEG36339.1 transcription elongation factor GreA [Amygdalobacter nucleatus]
MAEEFYEMTLEGVNRLNAELDRRKVEERTAIAERMKVARGFGDLSENSEYDEAKQAQSENEQRIQELENILKYAKVIEDSEIAKNKVAIGTIVKLEDVNTGEVEEYSIVGTAEEDIFSNKISSDSPVGQAVIGKRKGQQIEVDTPYGIFQYKITDISRK